MRWFKHESDARNSLKLRKVRRKYGADGYAIYWFCLEAIAYEIDKDNLTFELKEDAETIGFELEIQEKRVEEIMTYMVNIGLFESARNTITCLKMAERLDKTMTNSPRMRKWLDQKSVMTLGDTARHSATLDELEVEVEVEVEVEKIKEDLSFDFFWEAGMRKLGKKKAKSAFESAFKKMCKEEKIQASVDNKYEWANKLSLDIQARLQANQLGFDSMHPTTYLNGERWNDEVLKQVPSTMPDNKLSPSERFRQDVINKGRNPNF